MTVPKTRSDPMADKRTTPDMFSEIADRYDLLNHVLSMNTDRLWRRELIRLARVAAGGRVLDACTGTADVAIEFSRRSSAGHIVGLDRSAEMLSIGRRKVSATCRPSSVELVEGDVLELPFTTGTFDVVTVAFGLRNLPDYQQGVNEMARVLRPGGRLLILEFAPPKGVWLHGYRFYLRRILPVIGGLVSGSRRAYRYLAASIGDFIEGRRIGRLMEGAGLAGFRARKLTGGIAYIYTGEKPARGPQESSVDEPGHPPA